MFVFLSHSSSEKGFVRKLASDLEHEGIRSWLDEVELRVGEDLSAIERGIRETGCLVVVLSRAAARSHWVEEEIAIARGLDGTRILPVLVEDLEEGPQAERARLAVADFRVRAHYRRTLHQLAQAIHGLPNLRYFTAKQAAREIKNSENPRGQLFGLSHQGVATFYCFVGRRDWAFADVSTGASRLWIAEFFDADTACVEAYAMIDGKIHAFPKLFLLDSDPQPVPDSVVVYSCTLNEIAFSGRKQAPSAEEERTRLRHVAKRYTRFRPLPISRAYVDSPEAITSALACSRRGGMVGEAGEDLFTLAKLEHDKRDGGHLIWKVAFFDSTMLESVLTVGVDAVTGELRHPAMQAESLNAEFLAIRTEGTNAVFGLGHQWKAMDHKVWDIRAPGELADGLTAGEALVLADRLLAEDTSRSWQLAFFSNTGVVESLGREIARPEDRLMRADGTAGQWVLEVCGSEPNEVVREGRTGYVYDYQAVLVTRREGAVRAGPLATCGFTIPLAQCPLPERFLEAYERARALALRCAAVDFRVMSVALDRPRGGAIWCFRFYDDRDLLKMIRVSGDGRGVIA